MKIAFAYTVPKEERHFTEFVGLELPIFSDLTNRFAKLRSGKHRVKGVKPRRSLVNRLYTASPPAGLFSKDSGLPLGLERLPLTFFLTPLNHFVICSPDTATPETIIDEADQLSLSAQWPAMVCKPRDVTDFKRRRARGQATAKTSFA